MAESWTYKQYTYPAWFTLEITPDDVEIYGSEEEALKAKRNFYERADENGDDFTILGGAIAVNFSGEVEITEE